MKRITKSIIIVAVMFLWTGAWAQPDVKNKSFYVPRSEKAALGISILGTFVPLAVGYALVASYEGSADVSTFELATMLATSGLIAGQYKGFFYGDCPGRIWAGIGVRTAGQGLAISGIVVGMGGDI